MPDAPDRCGRKPIKVYPDSCGQDLTCLAHFEELIDNWCKEVRKKPISKKFLHFFCKLHSLLHRALENSYTVRKGQGLVFLCFVVWPPCYDQLPILKIYSCENC